MSLNYTPKLITIYVQIHGSVFHVSASNSAPRFSDPKVARELHARELHASCLWNISFTKTFIPGSCCSRLGVPSTPTAQNTPIIQLMFWVQERPFTKWLQLRMFSDYVGPLAPRSCLGWSHFSSSTSLLHAESTECFWIPIFCFHTWEFWEISIKTNISQKIKEYKCVVKKFLYLNSSAGLETKCYLLNYHVMHWVN